MQRVDSNNCSNNLYSIKEISSKTNPLIFKTKSNQKINNKKNIINQNNNYCNSSSEENSCYINTLINNETNKESPLIKAIYMQNINKIKELLEKGENPNISLMDGITPLHIAINKKNEKIIEYLLKYNANPNSKTIIEGKTPVHLAVINNSNEMIIGLLVEYGGSFEIIDNNNKTPMDYINNLDTFDIINNLLNGKKKNNIIEISNDEFSSSLKIFETISTENDIIINNNTIYTDSSEKKNNKKNIDNNDLNKDYFINKESNNLKKNLLDNYESSSELKSASKENINPNNCNYDILSSSINIQKIKSNFNKNKQEISRKITKRRTKSTLSELIQKNISLSLKSDNNLSNFIRINNKPKIIFDNILNLNSDNNDIINHRKSKSINNITINRLNIKNNKNNDALFQKNIINYSSSMIDKTKIFDNNELIKIIGNEKNDPLMKNNNNSRNKTKLIKKQIINKRKSIPFNQKNKKRDSLFSNISNVNKKEEEFNLSKLNINDDILSLYSNQNNNNIFRSSKSKKINKSLTQDTNRSFKSFNENNKYSFYNKYLIYYWLKDINLLNYYNIFLENNIFDFDKLIFKLKNGSFSLKKEDFQKIGIYIHGHIYRIITKLEIDSGKIKGEICNILLNKNNCYTIFSNTSEEIDDSSYYCVGCCEAKLMKNNYNKNIIEENILEIENWLNKIGLIKYKNNFIYNGFDMLSYFILQMFSSFPIDENIIREELEIKNDIDVDLILLQLNKEVKYILSKLRTNDKKIRKNGNFTKKDTYQINNINYPLKENCLII